MRLTKLDVVQRQLRTAIRMFFEDADTVSAYTLAAAAEGVLTGLLKKQGKVHPFRESDFIKAGMEAEFNRILNRPQNFFTHAKTDPDSALEFPAMALEYLLFQCAVLYNIYRGRSLREGFLFFIWFGLHHPDLIYEGPLQANLESMKQEAPNIATARSTYLEFLNRPDLYPLPNLD
jgi:hypothetical protein